jgi:hypothetical protein
MGFGGWAPATTAGSVMTDLNDAWDDYEAALLLCSVPPWTT